MSTATRLLLSDRTDGEFGVELLGVLTYPNVGKIIVTREDLEDAVTLGIDCTFEILGCVVAIAVHALSAQSTETIDQGLIQISGSGVLSDSRTHFALCDVAPLDLSSSVVVSTISCP